jgi:hypothetical protein
VTSEKYPTEWLTEEEARLRHPDCEVVDVFNIFDQDGERRAAIFVWRREEDTDQEGPVALYWLRTSFKS